MVHACKGQGPKPKSAKASSFSSAAYIAIGYRYRASVSRRTPEADRQRVNDDKFVMGETRRGLHDGLAPSDKRHTPTHLQAPPSNPPTPPLRAQQQLVLLRRRSIICLSLGR